MVGEAWTMLSGKGSYFQDQANPKPIFRFGDTGSQGIFEVTDFVITTTGPGMCLSSATDLKLNNS